MSLRTYCLLQLFLLQPTPSERGQRCHGAIVTLCGVDKRFWGRDIIFIIMDFGFSPFNQYRGSNTMWEVACVLWRLISQKEDTEEV